MPMPAIVDLNHLRERVRRLERPGDTRHGVLPFGIAALDHALPGGGLALGALHEIRGAGADEEDAAASAGFAAALAARIGGGPVLWCLKRLDLYGPGLAAHGLDPGRLVLVRAARDDDLLWAIEEGLRGGGIAAVIGEIGSLPMVASRRLQLAAERSGITALMIRRWRGGAEAAAERGRPSAAATRWRVAALPALPDADEPGIGRPRWHIELLRCRGGRTAVCDMAVDGFKASGEAHATYPVPVPAGVADRPAAPRRPATARDHRRAAS